MYIELKSEHGDKGPARIGRVSFSKSGLSIYYNGSYFNDWLELAYAAEIIMMRKLAKNTGFPDRSNSAPIVIGLVVDWSISMRMSLTSIGRIFESAIRLRIRS